MRYMYECLQKRFGPFIAFDISAFKESSQCLVTDLCLQCSGTQLIAGALVTTGGCPVSAIGRCHGPTPRSQRAVMGPHSRSVALWISHRADVTLSALSLSLENTGNKVYKENVKFIIVSVTPSQQDEGKSVPTHIDSSDDTQCLWSSCDS